MYSLLVLFFSALITLALVHGSAVYFFLYWKYTWLDVPVHFLGGAVAALGIAILPFFQIQFFERHKTLIAYICAVCVIGICWEMFEYNAGLYELEKDIVLDTSIDLIMDILGAILGYGIVKSIKQLQT